MGAVECDPFAALFADVSSPDASMEIGNWGLPMALPRPRSSLGFRAGLPKLLRVQR